ncbi:hypothetical protein TvY486_0018040 [Trypanosoma vivax Y486]|uniref:Uncharacterized protein n=1 Tax=Trypanosoma vivax (strain Y486) TaxID=1055687 RepID=F9WNI0_TRYVY|nr:hypothetical protein TvY486_0018040 [Trypanosoma vivax Y486]|eukprot:CCD19098.1 hypothetical protein TvY486_0018040 [Trypanosoma vivax Y486]
MWEKNKQTQTETQHRHLRTESGQRAPRGCLRSSEQSESTTREEHTAEPRHRKHCTHSHALSHKLATGKRTGPAVPPQPGQHTAQTRDSCIRTQKKRKRNEDKDKCLGLKRDSSGEDTRHLRKRRHQERYKTTRGATRWKGTDTRNPVSVQHTLAEWQLDRTDAQTTSKQHRGTRTHTHLAEVTRDAKWRQHNNGNGQTKVHENRHKSKKREPRQWAAHIDKEPRRKRSAWRRACSTLRGAHRTTRAVNAVSGTKPRRQQREENLKGDRARAKRARTAAEKEKAPVTSRRLLKTVGRHKKRTTPHGILDQRKSADNRHVRRDSNARR